MSYYVTFHLNNGQPDYVAEVEEGQVPEAPDDPAREGYYFEGFYTDQMLESEWDWSQPATSSYDVYGKWTAAGGEDETVGVVLDPANGDQPSLLRLAAGSTLPEWVLTDLPTWEGHRCTGWTLGNEPVDAETAFAADASLTAAWVVTHEVTFDPANGEAATVQVVDDGDSAERPDDPERDGYLFVGWQSGGSDYAFGPVTADESVTAAWEVTSNSDDDGSGDVEPADASDVADDGTYDEGDIDTTDPTDIPFTPTTPDTSANVGEAGEVNPDGVPETPDIFVPAQLVEITRKNEEYIQDYSAASLAALEASGAVPIAVYDDGTEAQVTWAEVVEPVIAYATASSEAAAVAAATNQHFWSSVDDAGAGGNGVHVTDDAQEAWRQGVADGFSDLGDGTGNTRPWHNILMNSLGILLRTGLRNLVSITKSAIAFYDGEGNQAGNVLASFGATGARIGKDSSSHITVGDSGMNVYTASGSSALYAGLQNAVAIVRAGLQGAGNVVMSGLGYVQIRSGNNVVSHMGVLPGDAADAQLSEDAEVGTAYTLPADMATLTSVELAGTTLSASDYSVASGKLTLANTSAVQAVYASLTTTTTETIEVEEEVVDPSMCPTCAPRAWAPRSVSRRTDPSLTWRCPRGSSTRQWCWRRTGRLALMWVTGRTALTLASACASSSATVA